MKYIAACERRTLRGLLAEIKDRWRSDWVPSVGNIAADASGAWGALKPEATGGQPPHLTVAIDAAGLSIFGNVETDRASSGASSRARASRSLAAPWSG